MNAPVCRALAALVAVLTLQAVLTAHDIPDEIVVQSYIRPQPRALQVLLRVPLIAISDANLPKDGTGYLAMAYLDPALREAANQISNGIVLMEGDERLTGYEMANARISLPSDRSFDSYDGAIARVSGARLPDTTQLYYNQGFNRPRTEALHNAMLERGLESPYGDWLKRWDEFERKERTLTTHVPCADFFEIRDKALIAHRTQIDPDGGWFRVPLDLQKKVWPTEEYELAKSLVDTSLPEDDLFAGIRDNG